MLTMASSRPTELPPWTRREPTDEVIALDEPTDDPDTWDDGGELMVGGEDDWVVDVVERARPGAHFSQQAPEDAGVFGWDDDEDDAFAADAGWDDAWFDDGTEETGDAPTLDTVEARQRRTRAPRRRRMTPAAWGVAALAVTVPALALTSLLAVAGVVWRLNTPEVIEVAPEPLEIAVPAHVPEAAPPPEPVAPVDAEPVEAEPAPRPAPRPSPRPVRRAAPSPAPSAAPTPEPPALEDLDAEPEKKGLFKKLFGKKKDRRGD